MVMSDRICLLNCGKIEQMDTPIAIYTHPRTKFAAGFIGSYNVLEPLEFGRVTGDIDLPGAAHCHPARGAEYCPRKTEFTRHLRY